MAVVVLLVATVFGVAPQASAQEGTPSVLYANIEWVTECDPVTAQGWFIFDYAVTLFAGYRVEWSYTQVSAGAWSTYSLSGSYISAGQNYAYSGSDWAPSDGYWTRQYDVYAANGVLMSSTMFRADCTTGEVWTSYGDVYGINEPAASARVMGTVLVDTPVYSDPSPTAALKPVLKAGQTWFIVGQTTGTDDALWYKVFVGGKNYGFVPASTMAPQGAVPGAK